MKTKTETAEKNTFKFDFGAATESIILIYWISFSLFLQEIQKLKNDKTNIALQRSMWLDLNTLLSVKIECHRDALEAGAGGTLSVNKGAETFTLS